MIKTPYFCCFFGQRHGLKRLNYTAWALRAVGFWEVLIKVACGRAVSRNTHRLFLANPTSLRAVSYSLETRGQYCKWHNNPLRGIPTLPRISLLCGMSLTLSAGSIIICPLSKLTISDQGPSHSATDSLSFRFNAKEEGEPENIFSPGTRTRSRRLSVLSHGTHLQ